MSQLQPIIEAARDMEYAWIKRQKQDEDAALSRLNSAMRSARAFLYEWEDIDRAVDSGRALGKIKVQQEHEEQGRRYVSLAAATEALAYALKCDHDAKTKAYDSLREGSMAQERTENFAAGVSYAIGMMLDPDTAAIIEQAARERAEEN